MAAMVCHLLTITSEMFGQCAYSRIESFYALRGVEAEHFALDDKVVTDSQQKYNVALQPYKNCEKRVMQNRFYGQQCYRQSYWQAPPRTRQSSTNPYVSGCDHHGRVR